MTKWNNHAKDLETSRNVGFRIMNVSGEVSEGSMAVAAEHFISVSVNGVPAFRLSCTPEYMTELVIGRLYTEQMIRNVSEVEELFICGKGEIAEVRLAEECDFVPSEGFEPTCCTGNEQYLAGKDVELKKLPEKKPEPERIFRLAEAFREDSELHRSTGGTHSCYLLSGTGELSSFEDIGRHNALDKAVGHMLLSGYAPEDCVLFTTGRVAADLITKAIAAGIPTLVSKSVPTDEALRLAHEYGMNLIVRAWPDSCWAAKELV